MANPTSSEPARPFGPIRTFLWPIHAHELKKFIPMFLMFFFISFVYSVLRNTKDTLVVTTPGGGADLIPFLKVYGTIPLAVLFMLVYARLSNRLSRRALFYATLAPFLVFFLGFAALFPAREAVQPGAWAEALHGHLPSGFATLAALVQHWPVSLFYVMAELWGSMALSLMFWTFANDIVDVAQAKRFYALFGIGANLALVAVKFANQGIRLLEARLAAQTGLDPWNAYVVVLMAVVALCILAVCGIHGWIHRNVLTDPRLYTPAEPEAGKADRPRLSLPQALRFLAKSRYLGFIAVLVVCYGIAINLVEVTWKDRLGMLYPNPLDYQDFMANFAMITGIVTIVLMLLVANNLLRIFGWLVTALVTPVVLLGSGLGFFGFILAEGALTPLLARLHSTPLAAAVLFGTVQNVMSKASKYSLFDPTKEMAYIPLDPESKVKGKAAIDVVGARLGKAGGSLLQQGLIAGFGSLRAVPGVIAVLLLATIAAWIGAAAGLGRAFARITGASRATKEG